MRVTEDSEQAVVDVDAKGVRWPRRPWHEKAGSWNWEFIDYSDVDWSLVDNVMEVEVDLVRRCIEEARAGEDYWACADRARDEMYELLFCEDPGLDFGVATATLALNAVGCPTYISCNGRGRGWAYVDFFAHRKQVPLLIEAATVAGIGLGNCHGGGLAAYTGEADGLLRFATELRRRADAFRAIELPASCRRRGADDGDESRTEDW